MKKIRIVYVAVILGIIILGLVSRRISCVPLYIGDVLWAMMMFFIIRLFFVKANLRYIFLTSLTICYMVEISQLCQAEWLINMRMTLPGRLILGQGFLWSDLIAYLFGIGAATFFEWIVLNHFLNKS